MRTRPDHMTPIGCANVELGPRRLHYDTTFGLVGGTHNHIGEERWVGNDHGTESNKYGFGTCFEPLNQVLEGGEIPLLLDGGSDDLLISEGSDYAALFGPAVNDGNV